MELTEYKSKIASFKKVMKILTTVTLVLTLASILILGFFNLAGVVTIHTSNAGSKYENSFTYPGWQTLYYGPGEMIIQGYTEFKTDIFTILGLYLPFLALIIGTVVYLKGKNLQKAIAEFVMAGTLVFGGVMLFNVDQFCIMSAAHTSDGGYTGFYESYLQPALNGEGSFTKTIYPTLVLLICLVTALVMIANGVYLLYVKKFAKENKPAATADSKAA